jgi:hypothetical protein
VCHRRLPSHRTSGALVCTAILLACTKPNPAYSIRRGTDGDPPTRDASADAAEAGVYSPSPDLTPDTPADRADLDGPSEVTQSLSPDAPGACQTAAECGSGFGCPAGACVLNGGLAMYWKFDEVTGTVAGDSSGRGVDGTYSGTTGTPLASSFVPTVMFSNPRSRAFVLANRHAVVAATPAALQPANNLTVAAWYRTTTTDITGTSVGSEIVNVANDYILRLRPTQIEFSKRSTGTTGSFAQCFAEVSAHLDGAWHHVAGVTSTAGMKVYFDGTEKCSNSLGGDLTYSADSEIWVGRHAKIADHNSFDGNMDDVRIYTTALSAADVLWLARGGP